MLVCFGSELYMPPCNFDELEMGRSKSEINYINKMKKDVIEYHNSGVTRQRGNEQTQLKMRWMLARNAKILCGGALEPRKRQVGRLL